MAGRRDGSTKRVWRERLGRYRGCELTVAALCAQQGVSTASFYAWRRRLGREARSDRRRAIGRGRPGSRASADEPPLFVPVSVKAATAEARIELPSGAVVHIPAAADERLVRSCIHAAAELLRPLYERMKQRVLASQCLRTDDTPGRLLDPEAEGGSRLARFWTYLGDEAHPYSV